MVHKSTHCTLPIPQQAPLSYPKVSQLRRHLGALRRQEEGQARVKLSRHMPPGSLSLQLPPAMLAWVDCSGWTPGGLGMPELLSTYERLGQQACFLPCSPLPPPQPQQRVCFTVLVFFFAFAAAQARSKKGVPPATVGQVDVRIYLRTNSVCDYSTVRAQSHETLFLLFRSAAPVQLSTIPDGYGGCVCVLRPDAQGMMPPCTCDLQAGRRQAVEFYAARIIQGGWRGHLVRKAVWRDLGLAQMRSAVRLQNM